MVEKVMVKRLIREGVAIELPFTVWIDEEGIDRIPEVGMRNWEYLKRIMGAITEKIEKAPKWVPVTERLPEERGRYLGYIVDDADNAKYTITCKWYPDIKAWFPDYEYIGDDVRAWMPLPESYEEGKE